MARSKTEETTVKSPQKESGGTPSSLLMISNKRHRAFYERAARELMASGHEEVELSALGDAVPLAVHLANCLADKEAAIITKIETKLVEFAGESQVDAPAGRNLATRAAGVSIIMKKHPQFKGTRIVPGYVFFCPEKLEQGDQAFPSAPDRWFASVNVSYDDTVFDPTTAAGQCFQAAMLGAGQTVEAYSALHQFLLAEALRSNQNESEMTKIKFVGELDAVRNIHSGLKAAFCRVCPELKENAKAPATGTVFVNIMGDKHVPLGAEKNCCMVHVQAPRGADYQTAEQFLHAVSLTANNLMNAVCDFNGYAKRYQGLPRLQRIGVVRVPMFSGRDTERHSQTTVDDVAKAILSGLNSGYHFGPAPRLQFLDTNGALRRVWIKECGQTEDSLQFSEGSFIPKERIPAGRR